MKLIRGVAKVGKKEAASKAILTTDYTDLLAQIRRIICLICEK
jgi:hypothetical protein